MSDELQSLSDILTALPPCLTAEGHVDTDGQRAQALALMAFSHSRVGILVTDANHRVVIANHAFSTITGYDCEEVLGWDIAHFHSREQKPEYYQQREQLIRDQHWRGEVLCQRKTGEFYPELLNIDAVRDDEGQVTHYVRTFIDISDLKEDQTRLHIKAHHDPLTGLANRLLFNDRLDHALKHAERNDQMLALLFIDLDHFKAINDSRGHAIGDNLLQQAARRLSQVLRSNDTLARFGGDEFVALLDHDVSVDSAQTVAMRLLEALEAPFQAQGEPQPLSASIGIALYPNDGESQEELLRNADSAMYRAKRAGASRHAFVDKGLSRQMQSQLSDELALRQALTDPASHFSVVYQPQMDLTTQQPQGLEALVRRQSPNSEHGPREFMALARSLGLAVPLDRWILHQVIEQHHQWRQEGSPLGKLPIAVNIVADHLFDHPDHHASLDRFLEEQLDDTGWLTLEIASDSLTHEPSTTPELLARLKRLGVNLAIDELGEGHVNFSYLARLPISQAKINGTLIAGVDEDARGRQLLAGIAQLLTNLGIDCMVVGVEDQAGLTALTDQGIQHAQGYHFAHPMPAGELETWMRMREGQGDSR
ncbi:putative bifunctional diguanylate cyclase/phosphodiesterase [Aidingimonas halophila]|uniref:PAS domain S-box-containing protein/diguanylate cyclase (GGDEF) domain-containing protein n=1 Tax=Aidingimonas halophila TaxID=574349 RepID=A0A1H2RTY7_9GAMM|nr:GGDEF and EAL domain-containing protein [Aidingimonas halophila]SDW22214.1 PAS domain S-box-containing protein/diguanylate cyclase (GGDEF) domain-containing protein [Aidingimonas halophila]